MPTEGTLPNPRGAGAPRKEAPWPTTATIRFSRTLSTISRPCSVRRIRSSQTFPSPRRRMRRSSPQPLLQLNRRLRFLFSRRLHRHRRARTRSELRRRRQRQRRRQPWRKRKRQRRPRHQLHRSLGKPQLPNGNRGNRGIRRRRGPSQRDNRLRPGPLRTSGALVRSMPRQQRRRALPGSRGHPDTRGHPPA